jgi:DNA transformation protein
MKDDSFREFVLDQLSGLGDVTCRAMFGGYGLYSGDTFFGIIFHGRLYLKTDESTRGDYELRGMKPFQPNQRQTMNYHEVPSEVVEDREQLPGWARKAIATARKK